MIIRGGRRGYFSLTALLVLIAPRSSSSLSPYLFSPERAKCRPFLPSRRSQGAATPPPPLLIPSTGVYVHDSSYSRYSGVPLRSQAHPSDDGVNKDELSNLLIQNTFGRRLLTLSANDFKDRSRLSVLAEAYVSGTWRLCIVTGVRAPQSKTDVKSQTKTAQPKLEVIFLPRPNDENPTSTSAGAKYSISDEKPRLIGIGDVTTVWTPALTAPNEEFIQSIQSLLASVQMDMQREFAVNHCELSMQNLYEETRGSGKGRGASGLTKKQIPNVASKVRDRARAEDLLRTVIKAGPGMHRLVDSWDAAKFLFRSNGNNLPSCDEKSIKKRIIGAEVLHVDSTLGGRFKRMPCMFVSAQGGNGDSDIEQMTILNGGWLALDSGNRVGAETRKFAERLLANASLNKNSGDNRSSPPMVLTDADERIVNRLECMAMGDSLEGNTEEADIERDVRDTLRALGMPVTSEGARDALICIGRWTEQSLTDPGRKLVVEPWPKTVLDAARILASFVEQRKELLTPKRAQKKGKVEGDAQLGDFEGRTNLSSIPCVCVDAKGTAFRDDAIGVRPRASTGRKVIDGVSKWEILIHIADVSDVFSPSPAGVSQEDDFTPLREVAKRRGYSRYDLPLGPLHLMPPEALKALAFRPLDQSKRRAKPNRCVTLWAYIDDNSGQLVDAGVERAIISAPVPLTFASASSLLETDTSQASPDLQKAQSILAVAERNLLLWSEHQYANSKAAAKRLKRMTAKAIVSEATRSGDQGNQFRYSRAHKIVDSALDLYGHALRDLLRAVNAPVPSAPGAGADRRARLGTAPLRRYVDAVAQRQALSVLCNYGGPPLSRKACKLATQAAAKASHSIQNFKSMKKGAGIKSSVDVRVLERLEGHLARLDGREKARLVRAISTGRQNEVVLEGIGVSLQCTGVDGSLSPGEHILVEIIEIDPSKGVLKIKLSERNKKL